MCGIAGIVAPKGFEPSTLTEMTQLIAYRGPDGYGFAFSGADGGGRLETIHNRELGGICKQPIVGLGNRRLAILDLSPAGNQPMQIEDGFFTITFNGEIYNYREIREELSRAGHRFQSHSDTEVILHAYQEWGEECLKRFNGMWAFALWDGHRRRLFCARDRFGVKPFYYALHNGRFFFASEIKQILRASEMPRTASPLTVFRFLEWGLLDCSSETFFEGVSQLPAGHYLVLESSEPLTPQLHRYWEIRTEPEINISDDDAIAEFRGRFENAVSLRLRSDVPVGVSLSGGLDSSSVVCVARRLSPNTRLETFSACFEDTELDEREYVAAVVRAIGGLSHLTFPDGPSFWKSLKEIIFHHDEPVGSPGAYAQWCVMSESRKKGVPVILGGQGGDESLCGYLKYQFFYWWHLLRRGDLKFIREPLQWLYQGTSSRWNLPALMRYLPGPFRSAASLSARIGTAQMGELLRGTRSGLGSGRTIAERQKTDLTYSSIPALLHHEDRSSMAHSVESRLPFLDYQLVEFLLRCPPSLKLRNGRSKWLLRHALAEELPEKIRGRRTKLGFHTPETQWMHLGLNNGCRDHWASPDLRMSRFVDAKKLRLECEAFLSMASGALSTSALFRAISLETWAHVYSVN